MLRTHTCGELRGKDEKKEATLCGWVHSRRDHGGVIFIDLRDRYGLTQIVFNPTFNSRTHQQAEKLRREDVLRVAGEVRKRGKGLENPNLVTGEIEVFVETLEILNQSDVPPLEIDDRKAASESVRLKYRYLDLRRPGMQQRLIMRHVAAQATRAFLSKHGFLEVETPLLIKHTPEGARDYIVPSRVHPGKVYSLPQSPQLFKQILMIAGFDRYFQLARCLRDEDLREDRQPEFTQIDIEMSFLTEEDIIAVAEGLIKEIWLATKNTVLKTPFQRMTYNEAMEKYGIDRPDLRFGLELFNITEIISQTEFKVFKEVVAHGGIVKGINVPSGAEKLSRNQIDEYIKFAQENGASGLAWMKVTEKGLESNIVKYFPEDTQKELLKIANAKKGDLLFFVAEKPKKANDVLARIRLKLGHELGLIKENDLKFAWVVDFPLLEWDEEEQRWGAMHHPFTAPKPEDLPLLEKEPGKVRARAYDLVLNGIELGGGSIRNNTPALQEKVLHAIGMSHEQAEEKFGFLLEALRYGAPPHGGIAFGFDRICALLQGTSDIREVIAFPKTKSAESPMDGSPSPIEEKHLKELHLQLDDVAKKNVGKG